ncbi:MAG: DUF72 domain-containing protein [Phycisphaerales bacterium]
MQSQATKAWAGRSWIGTSGFSYKEWKGSFYPEDIRNDAMLSYYASKLSSVEINNTFYRLPRASVVEGWAAEVPSDFRFTIKASKRITHIKRLKEADDEVSYLLDTISTLGPRLGVVLYQLPPNFKIDLDRLGNLLKLIPDGFRSVLEFRHESWTDDAVVELLREHNAALCLADVDDAPEPQLIATADFGYLRLRRAAYTDAELAGWVDKVQAQTGWQDVYVYFKHEDGGSGPAMAVTFRKLIEGSQ